MSRADRGSPGGRYADAIAGCSAMLAYGRRFAERTCAIHGRQRIGGTSRTDCSLAVSRSSTCLLERYVHERHELLEGKSTRPLAAI
jgi:hypothetical protein